MVFHPTATAVVVAGWCFFTLTPMCGHVDSAQLWLFRLLARRSELCSYAFGLVSISFRMGISGTFHSYRCCCCWLKMFSTVFVSMDEKTHTHKQHLNDRLVVGRWSKKGKVFFAVSAICRVVERGSSILMFLLLMLGKLVSMVPWGKWEWYCFWLARTDWCVTSRYASTSDSGNVVCALPMTFRCTFDGTFWKLPGIV